MHILIVTDQHAESLGGVQVAIRLQRRFLERLGHTVTIVAPRLHRPGYEPEAADREVYLDLPSWPITRDREYGISWPGARTDRALASALRGRPPVDLVHVQGDFWGAMIGLRAARGLNAARAVPVVHTMHNHVDEGTRAVTPFAPVVAPLAFRGLRAWRALALGAPLGANRGAAGEPGRQEVRPGDRRARGAWRYLAELAAEATVVTAPSQHFADELVEHGVASEVLVTPNGVDDDAIARTRAQPRPARKRPELVWLGRMSHEKRVLEFVEAVGRSGIDADVVLHGAGLLLPRVRARIAELGLRECVRVEGPVPYAEALSAMRRADALVQTSIGFETQGLTPFEAAALGTPTIFCDPAIADDVAVTPEWRVEGASVEALAATLRRAVDDLRADPALRVPEAEGQRFLQSSRTRAMVELYERLIAAAR